MACKKIEAFTGRKVQVGPGVKASKGELSVALLAPGTPRRKRVKRKQVVGQSEECQAACRQLGLVPFVVARREIGQRRGFGRPVSRQHIYTLINSRELVQGVSVAGLATVTSASLDTYLAKLGKRA